MVHENSCKGHIICCTLSLRFSLEPHARKCCVCSAVYCLHKTEASWQCVKANQVRRPMRHRLITAPPTKMTERSLTLSELNANSCGSEDQTDHPRSSQSTMETFKDIKTVHACTKQGGASVSLPSHHSQFTQQQLMWPRWASSPLSTH